jgi:Cys-tRNA(Pro) deacylase
LHSLEQAARERGQEPDQVVRSILFRVGEGQFVMVLMPGPQQVSWPALRKHLGKSRLTMASEAEVLRETGYTPGAVSPFGLPAPIPVLVDQGLLSQTEISIGSGERGVTVILQVKDLLSALDQYEIGSFCKS